MGEHKRILIVDDDAMVLFIFEKALTWSDNSYEIVTTPSGHDALDQVRQKPFELVITDMCMPDLGGVELTEAVKGINPGIPVVWITGCDCYNIHADAVRLGIQGCYDKPLQVDEIRDIVRRALGIMLDDKLRASQEYY